MKSAPTRSKKEEEMIHVCVISLLFVLYLQANVLGSASKVKMLTKI